MKVEIWPKFVPRIYKIRDIFLIWKKNIKILASKLRNFWNLGLSIYSINRADPASLQPEPEPEPNWKKVAG